MVALSMDEFPASNHNIRSHIQNIIGKKPMIIEEFIEREQAKVKY